MIEITSVPVTEMPATEMPAKRASSATLIPFCAAALCAALGLHCASPPPEPSPSAESTAGGEEIPATPPAPTGPALRFERESDVVVARIDLTPIRGASFASEATAMLRSAPNWRRLLAGSEIDPIEDIDRVLVIADAMVTDHQILVIEHRLTNTQIRERVLAMSVSQGSPAPWQDADGIAFVTWPAETEPAYQLFLSGEHQVILATEVDRDRVLEVAQDHLRRQEAGQTLASSIALEPSQVATIVAQEVSPEAQARMRYAPDAFTLELSTTSSGGYHADAQATYPTPEAAENARAYYEGRRSFFASQMLVRAVGLDGPLRNAHLSAEGPALSAEADLSEEEVERVFGVLALGGL